MYISSDNHLEVKIIHFGVKMCEIHISGQSGVCGRGKDFRACERRCMHSSQFPECMPPPRFSPSAPAELFAPANSSAHLSYVFLVFALRACESLVCPRDHDWV